jgi:tetratricopeptide (TPR) repeat protein
MTWLELIPQPRPRPEAFNPFGEAPIQWDVFISYRSTNRYWAVALYDQLTLAGFRVFLDQFVLRPGIDLEISLSESLKKSASGVLVLSEDVEGAPWVQGEYTKMKAQRDERSSSELPFNYVIARIDKSPLPFKDGNMLYCDFSEGFEDGPRGAELVRLIHGLVGVPLSDGAARTLNAADEQTKELLTKLAAASKLGKHERIVELMQSGRPELAESPAFATTAAQLLISTKHPEEALAVIRSAQKHFPRSVRLRQLEGLALRRLKHVDEAQDVLAQLYVEKHRDPETLGIFAATWWVRYEKSRDRADLERSRSLYLEAFELSPKDEYVGINAASKSALLGELDTAREIATRVGKLVGKFTDGADFYKSLTLAEALVLVGSYDAAARVYQAARQKHPERGGDVEGTLVQLNALVAALGISEDSAAKLRKSLGG